MCPSNPPDNSTGGIVPVHTALSLSVIIINEDRLVAEGIRRIAEKLFSSTALVVVHRAADALAALRARPAQLALVGLTLPDLDGLDLLEMIAEERLAKRTLVVSGRRDECTQEFLRSRTSNTAGWFDTRAEDP
ncbi:MAG: response regulator [Opitutaceae bacterium]